MGEHDDEELQKAFLMSLQPVPDAKRSKPRDNISLSSSSPRDGPSSSPTETHEARQRRLQREVLAAAAEQRWTTFNARDAAVAGVDRTVPSSPHSLKIDEANERSKGVGPPQERKPGSSLSRPNVRDAEGKRRIDSERQLLSVRMAERLYTTVFGTDFSKEVLAQWCNQGFRFSQDLETSVGLVQQEGGPCGVLAPIQALVLKYLLFVPEDDADAQLYSKRDLHLKSSIGKTSNFSGGSDVDPRLTFSDVQRTRALVRAMGETLWTAGGRTRAVLVVLDIPGLGEDNSLKEAQQDEALADALDGISLDSVKEFHRLVRVYAVQSASALHVRILSLLSMYRSRLGALLMLFSALLSRGLDAVQSDRDDPDDHPLVTPPFGHASQEIVNLLLCGQAVSNVFDGSMDLGGGMCLKGIPTNVEVGFLSLLESLNLCKVGQRLKRPVWPVWVVGSESHYTVLFALSTTVQDESDIEDREVRIRQAFDSHDQSGGGGFISLDALHQLIRDLNIEMPPDMFNNFCSSDIVVWNEFWRSLCQLDITKGGLKDNAAHLGKRYFELLHFNGIAKTVTTDNGILQRPRLIKLRVTVPPKWTPENAAQENTAVSETTTKEEPPQHAPLVDCIRTRWQRASCNWSSDAPSIV